MTKPHNIQELWMGSTLWLSRLNIFDRVYQLMVGSADCNSKSRHYICLFCFL